MELLDQPLRTAEFVALDVETNGRVGEECELTEVGAVLVGGGELHERFQSLVAVRRPLPRGVQRLTGITQSMVECADPPARVLPRLAERLEGRVMVAHVARFDRGALAHAFAAEDLRWPDPPVLCTVALARRFAPLAGQRRLAALARALDIPVEQSHRALPDAETCARIFCALFGRLCAHAQTVRDAVELLGPRRRARRRRPPGRLPAGAPVPPDIDFAGLPDGPGVYVFRDGAGRPLYVGKSVRLRSRARSHFAPGSPRAGWTGHAAVVDHHATRSELAALVLESRLIKRLRPPGNVNLRRVDRWVYIRCRLDIPFPILEVAPRPAAGLAVCVGPLRGRAAAAELVEQLNSLFGLRHCGRRLQRRDHPSAYGQMGRCLSPCLGDLDPNLYRRRLDAALALFAGDDDARGRLLEHVETRMSAAAAELKFERAAALRRRHKRLAVLLERLEGVLRAAHAAPRLVLAPGAARTAGFDAFWLVGGRVADWGPAPGELELERRTSLALASRPPPGAPGSIHPDEVDEARIVATWLASHPEVPCLALDPPPPPDVIAAFVAAPGSAPLGTIHGAEGHADLRIR
ncbi:MAG TPA: exonuclease domain-containing protein [Solirubrobacteraceae bacterium]|nr:exonuclease domain-containing protein [Solirubrobacteraceae bacterium]